MQQVQAILLAGGSAFGLDAASGVVRYLDEHRLGYAVGDVVVPIVPAAILYDLEIGDAKIRPTAESGYKACQAATAGRVVEGNVGAGAGATIGKMFGMKQAMKSGLGSASVRVGDTGIVVGAIVAVNAVRRCRGSEDRKDHRGRAQAGWIGFMDSMARIREGYSVRADAATNTTIGVVATNVALDKAQATKVAQMAHDGLARTIYPVHTPSDGDTIFAGASGIDYNARESRRHRRAGCGGDGTSSAAGGDERARNCGAAQLFGSDAARLKSSPRLLARA